MKGYWITLRCEGRRHPLEISIRAENEERAITRAKEKAAKRYRLKDPEKWSVTGCIEVES